MRRLAPRLQNYDWGSHHVLAELTGRPSPTERPEAELWFGAHEAAPSGVGDDTLDQLIAANPELLLGDSCASQFARRLPFLLKVLAPERCLSIQCHPSAQQAVDAPAGTYPDLWPKPEALLAITEFEVFAGLKPFAQTAQLMRSLDLPELSDIVDVAEADGDCVRALLRAILTVPDDVRKPFSDKVIDACRALDEPDSDVRAVLTVADQFPGDIGLVVLLSMEHRVVAPGDYAFVPAGVLHAYMRGAAVEILANSDNIVRAGLTPKAINIPELLRILEPDMHLVTQPPTISDGVVTYPSRTDYFQLHSAIAGPEPVAIGAAGAPRILLALQAPVEVTVDGARETLQPGEAVFVGADEGALGVCGSGTAYLATTG